MFPTARLLRVNLTENRITVDTLESEKYRLYPGGSALGMYILFKELKPGIDPLSSQNIMVFAVSPLTGLPISGQSRMAVCAKSPLTGGIGDSQAGGFFPKELKSNGWDAIIFEGCSEKPVYLFIDGDRAELRDAGAVWGKITGETEDILRSELEMEDLEIAQIGPAGENLVLYASIMNMSNRANGRSGMGAVMGSKKLKAVVVKKQKGSVKPFDPVGFKKLTSNVKERISENEVVSLFHLNGTAFDLDMTHMDGFLPSMNYSTGVFPEAAKNLDGQKMTDTILLKRDTCYACAVRCKRVVDIPGVVDPRYGGPEYETVATMGTYCGISSLENTAVSNQLCNMYGLDTISCGATISFAMECFESGIISPEDTGGIDLRFGNKDAVNTLIPMIAKKEGFGALLAEGSRKAAEIIGGGAEKYAMHVKGYELPAHMPQYKTNLAILYSVTPLGADHMAGEHDHSLLMPSDSVERNRLNQIGIWRGESDTFSLDSEKVRFAMLTQHFYSLCDSLCLCLFCWGPGWQLYGPSELVDLCKYGIGWETSVYELMKIGERRLNLMKYFNVREGIGRDADKLPSRLFKPLPEGPAKGRSLDENTLNEAIDLYYSMAGWDPDSGRPTDSKLKELSIGWVTN